MGRAASLAIVEIGERTQGSTHRRMVNPYLGARHQRLLRCCFVSSHAIRASTDPGSSSSTIPSVETLQTSIGLGHRPNGLITVSKRISIRSLLAISLGACPRTGDCFSGVELAWRGSTQLKHLANPHRRRMPAARGHEPSICALLGSGPFHLQSSLQTVQGLADILGCTSSLSYLLRDPSPLLGSF